MVLIFLTGAVVLALEVLASRIMTPYFGVSLYIWAGILSITLTFLAVGYYLGGQATRRLERVRHDAVFFALPVASAAAIIVACAIYPMLFPALAQFDLVVGSFVASAVLLALPLIALSAMNPLLIAMRSSKAQLGDGGAGQVFFVSTVGSVAGVMITAFAIIPNLTNFQALLWLAIALCVAAAIACLNLDSLTRPERLKLVGSAFIITAIGAAFLLGQDRYLNFVVKSSDRDEKLAILAEYTSVFGNIKVLDSSSKSNKYPPIKALFQDGAMQNRTTRDNRSMSMYTYVLDRLAQGFAANAKTALVLGLGAGIVPRDFKKRGLETTVVDINSDVVRAARTHFGFDPADFKIELQDARTYVRNCESSFDVAVVDLFQGDGTPDYLMTREFFSDLRRCLGPKGVMVMNVFFDPENDVPNKRLLATVSVAFKQVYAFQLRNANSFVVATASIAPEGIEFSLEGVPHALRQTVGNSLSSGRLVTRESLLGYEPLTDRQNLFSTLIASARMRYRSLIVSYIHPRALVN